MAEHLKSHNIAIMTCLYHYSQASEKYLKHVVSLLADRDDDVARKILLKHNQEYLYDYIVMKTQLPILRSDVKWMEKLFYTTRYLADEDFNYNASDIQKAYRICNSTKQFVDNYQVNKESVTDDDKLLATCIRNCLPESVASSLSDSELIERFGDIYKSMNGKNQQ